MSDSKLIFKIIPKVMGEIGAVEKERRNLQQNYQFRGIDDFINAVHGPFHRNGIFVVPQVLNSHREERESKTGGTLIYTVLDVKFLFYAPDGSFIEAITKGEGMDSGDKSNNKAMSAAFKYALTQVFAIPTNDESADSESASPEPRSKRAAQAQPAKPKEIPNHAPKAKAVEPEVMSIADELVGFGKNKDLPFREVPMQNLLALEEFIHKNKIDNPKALQFLEMFTAYRGFLQMEEARRGVMT